MSIEVIHYGTIGFHPDFFKPIENKRFVKPEGGFWTSPVNSKWGWKDWCDSEDFRPCIDGYKYNVNGNIITIDCVEDMLDLPWFSVKGYDYIDFELLAKSYDAIHLTKRGEELTRFTHPKSLYGWDCESVLILNKSAIKEVASEAEV